VKPNAGVTGYPDGFEVEFTDKPHHQNSESSGDILKTPKALRVG